MTHHFISSASLIKVFPFSGKGKIRSIPDDDNDDDVVVFLFIQFHSNQSIFLQVCLGHCCCCYPCFVVFVCNAIVDVVVVIKALLIVLFSKGEDGVVYYKDSGLLLRRNK